MPTVLIIAGPNGAGKTTFANAVLSRRPEPFEFVNADEIARRLGDVEGERARDLLAGRRMLRLLDELTAEGRDIPLETTLATLSHAHRIERWRDAGWRVELVYLRLASVEDSLARVRGRVAMGGHDILEADIRRRFPRSLDYLERVYKPIVDGWWGSGGGNVTALNMSGDPQLIEDALREAAWKARHGTREERAGKFLGRQAAVEKAVADLGAKPLTARAE